MVRVIWEVEELVALIDVYRNSEGKSSEQINTELMKLSTALEKRANTLGIPHDEKFRNLNGMKMMYQNVVYIATDGQAGMSSTSSSMRIVYEFMLKAPDAFNLILEEFRRRYY